MTKQANKHRQEPDFDVRDKVWITTKNWKTNCPSRKLDYLIASPYEILEQVGNAYKLNLPDSVCVHPVFSPDKLYKAFTDPLPGQTNNLPPPI
jgi:hypothetical protein